MFINKRGDDDSSDVSHSDERIDCPVVVGDLSARRRLNGYTGRLRCARPRWPRRARCNGRAWRHRGSRGIPVTVAASFLPSAASFRPRAAAAGAYPWPGDRRRALRTWRRGRVGPERRAWTNDARARRIAPLWRGPMADERAAATTAESAARRDASTSFPRQPAAR